jgi:hypothetical protein
MDGGLVKEGSLVLDGDVRYAFDPSFHTPPRNENLALTPSPHMQTPSSQRAENARVLEEHGRRPSMELVEVTAKP